MRDGWMRRAPLSPSGETGAELWELWEDGRLRASLPVRTRYGKPLDVMAFRGIDAEAHRAAAAEVRRAAEALHAGSIEAEGCPCCGGPAADRLATIAGVDYLRCESCGHGFVPRPPAAALAERFAASEELAAVYTDPEATATRMEQVVRPKLDWTIDAARRALGRPPSSLLDIGAGAGHMVAAARGRGLAAEGYEINAPCCEFAADTLDVALRRVDVLSAEPTGERFDLVTLWGVLEYVPDPVALIRRAAAFLAPRGALVVEVPRADSLSTGVQRELPDLVARHLDPGSHLNAFSDASLATALWACGLVPTDAWYFGMDAFELATQLSLRADQPDDVTRAALRLQPDLDRARLADDLVLAAIAAPAP